MPKTSTATIRLVMKKNRKNKNGEFPIYLVVCFNGRLEKATKVSCLEKNWDTKNECVKKGQANYALLNKILLELKNKVIKLKNYYEFEGKTYTAAMLFDEIEEKPKNNYKELMYALINERQLKPRTAARYEYSWRKLQKFFGREFILEELTLKKVKQFIEWLDVDDGTKGDILQCAASVWNYAIIKNVVDAKDYPFREVKVSKMRFHDRDYTLEPEHM